LIAGLPFRSTRYPTVLAMTISLVVLLVACGGDDADEVTDIATGATPTPETTADDAVDENEEVDPTPVEEAADPTPPEEADEPTPVEDVAEPTPEPTPEVDLAPELAGLTDWRNIDPVSLEDLRGEPVVLVFWNSI
jgi:hypothetical protein